MALDMTTALTIRAKVDGTNQIDGLNAALGRTTSQANAASGAFGKLGALSKSIGSGHGALVPAATIAGIGALAKRSIDAADNLNDLSKRTGVGVESLSRFGAAAADSGTTVDEVAKAMGRLARGVVDPASQTSKALQSIGVSAIDANGKVRSLDQIMLSVSDVFAKMPDGAQKTALAMEIFGKAGANLIPMLNEGSAALGQYSATIDTEMAQAADKFNDSINAISIAVSGPFNEAVTALLPLITSVA
ncbi:MAG: phage tail tape measure protein, partial [Propionibacteriaceae bacterium]